MDSWGPPFTSWHVWWTLICIPYLSKVWWKNLQLSWHENVVVKVMQNCRDMCSTLWSAALRSHKNYSAVGRYTVLLTTGSQSHHIVLRRLDLWVCCIALPNIPNLCTATNSEHFQRSENLDYHFNEPISDNINIYNIYMLFTSLLSLLFLLKLFCCCYTWLILELHWSMLPLNIMSVILILSPFNTAMWCWMYEW